MGLSADLLLRLSRKYEPDSVVDHAFRGKDLTIRTDAEGNAIVLFIGRRESSGRIKGQRYARTLKTDRDGRVIRDHWDLKGST